MQHRHPRVPVSSLPPPYRSLQEVPTRKTTALVPDVRGVGPLDRGKRRGALRGSRLWRLGLFPYLSGPEDSPLG